MEFNFDEPINRNGSYALKWDLKSKIFGKEEVLPLWIADMDFAAPPCVQEAIHYAAQHGIYGYTLTPESYLEALIDWQKIRHGWNIDKDWILHSPGVVPALNFAVQAFTHPGAKVIIQSPVYPPFFSAVTNNYRKIANNTLSFDGTTYTIDWADLESKMKEGAELLMLCSPHNPVGRVWQKEELERLGALCLENNIPIVADEIHGDLVYYPRRHLSLASISWALQQNSITLTSASKTFNLAGLQSASAIIPNEALRQKYSAVLMKNGIFFKSLMGIMADEAAYREGGPWLDALLEYLSGNLEYLTEYIKNNIRNIEVLPPEGTYLVWLDCRALNLTDADLHKFFIEEAGLGLNDGVSFGRGGEGFMRINIACSRVILEKAMNRLKSALDKI